MASDRAEKPMLLALGGDTFFESLSTDTYRVSHMTCDVFCKMTRDDFEEKSIQLVLSALFCAQTDCIEIGQRLHSLGFQGTYLIRADTLPNPAIIKRELRQLYPGLDFRIVMPDEMTHALDSPEAATGQ
ncbi:hypothetical protein MUY35_00190 [Aliiroseovarius sp. S1339]|uniref:hypothetical protein n=1 Tax=Aliiroseovarius sp. S1339 TaxID=2936990 RepID=UPI0020BE3237|nr:hypothetical protein [Aliiroseovarius sp. S1339]MCK8462264.1 hypothetical protein [Aliiroseovarius sp. S1339]